MPDPPKYEANDDKLQSTQQTATSDTAGKESSQSHSNSVNSEMINPNITPTHS